MPRRRTGAPIPARYAARCVFCDSTVDVGAEGTYQFAYGWLRNRSAGGANAVTLPQRVADRYACGPCIDKAKAAPWEQLSMDLGTL